MVKCILQNIDLKIEAYITSTALYKIGQYGVSKRVIE